MSTEQRLPWSASPQRVAWAALTLIEAQPYRHADTGWSTAPGDTPNGHPLSWQQQDRNAQMVTVAWVSHVLGWRHRQGSAAAVSVSGEVHTHADIARVALGLSDGDAAWLTNFAGKRDGLRALRLIASGLYEPSLPLASQVTLRHLEPDAPASAVARAVLHAIAVAPELYDQRAWIGEGGATVRGAEPCGTALCIGGWAAALTGWELHRDDIEGTASGISPTGQQLGVMDIARSALRLTHGGGMDLFAPSNLDVLEGLTLIAADVDDIALTDSCPRHSIPAETSAWSMPSVGGAAYATVETPGGYVQVPFTSAADAMAYACQTWAANGGAPLASMRWKPTADCYSLVPVRFPVPPGFTPYTVTLQEEA